MRNKTIYLLIAIFLLIGNTVIGQIISGKVFVNNYQNPAIGAAIMIKDSNKGVVTDVNGEFSLELDSLDCILSVSLQNYSTLEIEVNSQDIINVSLENNIIDLVDFMIIAFTSIDEKDKNEGVWAENITRIVKLWDLGESYEWSKTIYDNMDYPLLAAENGIQGDVYVRLSIDTLGKMQEFKILNMDRLDLSLTKEVTKTFERMPIWSKNDIDQFKGIGGFFHSGKYWTGIYTLPIKYRIESEE